jgi:hypothetical protein
VGTRKDSWMVKLGGEAHNGALLIVDWFAGAVHVTELPAAFGHLLIPEFERRRIGAVRPFLADFIGTDLSVKLNGPEPMCVRSLVRRVISQCGTERFRRKKDSQ